MGCSSNAVRPRNIQMMFPNDTRWHTFQAIQDLSFFFPFFYKDTFCVWEEIGWKNLKKKKKKKVGIKIANQRRKQLQQ